jgi:hypothetical protein
MRGTLRTGMSAGATAAILSGIPSTIFCLATGRDALEATEAAGTILLPRESRRIFLLAAAVPVHATMSLAWAMVLAAVLPRRGTVLWGAMAGLAIAALDLGPLARPFPQVKALPRGPQIADHVAFGALAALMIDRARDKAAPSAGMAP